jgi:hypothetical protein
MTIQTYVGTFTSPLSTGQQAITGIPFQPTAVIIWTAAPSSGWATADLFAMGFCAGTGSTSGITQGYVTCGSANGSSGSVGYRRYNTSAAIGLVGSTGTLYIEATLYSMDSGGFTLNWGTVSSGTQICNYMAIGGTTNAKVVGWQNNLGTVPFTQSVGVGFTPDCVIHIGASTGAQTPPGGTPIAAGSHAALVLNDGIHDIDAFGVNGTQPSALTINSSTSGVWSGWTVLSGSYNYSPMAVCRESGLVDVYVVGADYAVYETSHASNYGTWVNIGGTTHHGVTACSMTQSREDIFITDYSSSNVYQKYWTSTGGWSGWINLGGTANSGPGACSYASNQMAVFIQGTDGYTWWKYWSGTWSTWASLGGPQLESTNHPAACGHGGNIYLFITTLADAIAYTVWNGSSWSGWTTVPGIIMTSSPEVQITSDGTTVHYAARGNDQAIWHTTYDVASGVFGASWESLGGTFP